MGLGRHFDRIGRNLVFRSALASLDPERLWRGMRERTSGSYTRIGYTRFSLHNFVFADESVVLKAREVEGIVPTVWLWRTCQKQGRRSSAFPGGE
jgi:hypothetical protein